MTAFDYTDAAYAIRPDLPGAYRKTWEWVAGPGSWWTGAERVAIAAASRAARDCALCSQRRQALSPEAGQGQHDGVAGELPLEAMGELPLEAMGELPLEAMGELPLEAVDAVHRIVSDPSRLSASWLEKLFAGGRVSDGHYVELLGIVVCVASIDGFHRALGLPLEPLPAPHPGRPSGYRPSSAAPGVGWVPMIPAGEARGAEADLYPARMAPNVLRAMSLVPDCVRQMQRLSAAQYVPMLMVPSPHENAGRSLSRPQIELVAARVSAVNECFY